MSKEKFDAMIKHVWENKTCEDFSLYHLSFEEFYEKIYNFYLNNDSSLVHNFQTKKINYGTNKIITFNDDIYNVYQYSRNIKTNQYNLFFKSDNASVLNFMLIVEKKIKALINKYNKHIVRREWYNQFKIDYSSACNYTLSDPNIESVILSWTVYLYETKQEIEFTFCCNDFDSYDYEIGIKSFSTNEAYSYDFGIFSSVEMKNDMLIISTLPNEILKEIKMNKHRTVIQLDHLLDLKKMIMF